MNKACIDLQRYFKLTDAANQAIDALKDAVYSARTNRDRDVYYDAKITLETALDNVRESVELTETN